MLKFKITFLGYITSMSNISFKIGFETKDTKLYGIPGKYRAKVKQENSAHNTLSNVTFFLLVFFLIFSFIQDVSFVQDMWFWCENILDLLLFHVSNQVTSTSIHRFVQSYHFRRLDNANCESPETMRKLCLSTKFPHQKIRAN